MVLEGLRGPSRRYGLLTEAPQTARVSLGFSAAANRWDPHAMISAAPTTAKIASDITVRPIGSAAVTGSPDAAGIARLDDRPSTMSLDLLPPDRGSPWRRHGVTFPFGLCLDPPRQMRPQHCPNIARDVLPALPARRL
ncbi:hypothetical protein KXR53_32890 [Inquilinus limosus]